MRTMWASNVSVAAFHSNALTGTCHQHIAGLHIANTFGALSAVGHDGNNLFGLESHQLAYGIGRAVLGTCLEHTSKQNESRNNPHTVKVEVRLHAVCCKPLWEKQIEETVHV